jgi:hypothetical protein
LNRLVSIGIPIHYGLARRLPRPEKGTGAAAGIQQSLENMRDMDFQFIKMSSFREEILSQYAENCSQRTAKGINLWILVAL